MVMWAILTREKIGFSSSQDLDNGVLQGGTAQRTLYTDVVAL